MNLLNRFKASSPSKKQASSMRSMVISTVAATLGIEESAVRDDITLGAYFPVIIPQIALSSSRVIYGDKDTTVGDLIRQLSSCDY